MELSVLTLGRLKTHQACPTMLWGAQETCTETSLSHFPRFVQSPCQSWGSIWGEPLPAPGPPVPAPFLPSLDTHSGAVLTSLSLEEWSRVWIQRHHLCDLGTNY